MSTIAQHYQNDSSGKADHTALWQTISDTLTQADIPLSRLSTDLLAPIDQLHIGGRKATQHLIDQADLAPDSRILEIGSGLGGSARLIADRIPCHITAVDITPSFIFASKQINRQLGYHQIRSVCADACLPQVEPGTQDAAISQHTLMNIKDRRKLLSTLHASLKPGGKLLLHEVLAGNNSDALTLPVPWASEPAHSHLPGQVALIKALEEQGFALRSISNVSQEALAWRDKHSKREAGESEQGRTQQQSPLNPRLIFGERFIRMGQNVMTNLADDKVQVVEAIFEKL